MKKINRILISAFLGLLLFGSISDALAQNTPQSTPSPTHEISQKVPIEVFVREGCGHCQDEKAFLMELKLRRNDFEVRLHDIDEPTHYEHWKQLTELEKLPKAVPITLVGNVIIQGFDSNKTTGKRIEQLINQSLNKKTMNFEEFIAAGGTGKVEAIGSTCEDSVEICAIEEEPLLVTLPLLGAVNLKNYSLPLLSLILGFVDGFNPCAMWVLMTFLIILIDAGSRKKIWQLAGLFILAEAIMYYLILNVWFTAWDFVGLDNIITPIVGLIAVGAGLYFLHEWKNSDGTCKVTSAEKRVKTRNRIQKLVNAEITLLTTLGIIGLAFSVNIIEFACSVGIPQAFTKILDLNNLSTFWEQFYMGLYILMYMLDDVIVFAIAIYSFEKIGITTKYTKISHFIGGVLMIILGLILLINPGLLVV